MPRTSPLSPASLVRALLPAALLAALLAVPARADWFPAEAVDGPSAGIRELGDVDLARDGTGGLVYVKDEGGVPHVFLSRFHGGAWRAPERVDVGIDAPASEPVIAAGDDHRLVIVWISGGRLHGVLAPGGGPNPLPGPQALHPDEGVSAPHVDMGINGTAYAVFAAPGAGGADVRAVRAHGTAWEGVPAALDISDRAAGDGAGRPRVAVAADGNGVAVWGEDHPDGRRRVHARRITGTAVSAFPREVSLPDFSGAPAGGADSPDIDIEDDNSYAWVVWRQDFGGRSRGLARRLVGSDFDPPVAIDAGGPAEAPRVSINGRGIGIAAAALQGANGVVAPLLEQDAFTAAHRVDGGGGAVQPVPVVGASERQHSAVAWRSGGALDAAIVRARYRPKGRAYEPETVVSRAEYGPAAPDGLEIGEDRTGNVAVAFLQGGPGARWIVAAVYDRHPSPPIGQSTQNWRRWRRPPLKWRAGSELWGAQNFRVIVDGQVVGTTTGSTLAPPVDLADGVHRWQVVAVDRRGQEAAGRSRWLRVDGTPPELRVRVEGARKRGSTLEISVRARDAGGSRLKYTEIDFGDGSRVTRLRRVKHRYMRPGVRWLRVRAVDRARNVTRESVRLRIRR